MPKMTVIDCFGHPNTDTERFRLKEEKWTEIAEDASGAVYFRFGNGTKTPIQRIATENGTTTQLWAYGEWANRESLVYSLALNETLAIETE